MREWKETIMACIQIFMATYLLSSGDSMVFANSDKVPGLPPGEYNSSQSRINQNRTNNYFSCSSGI